MVAECTEKSRVRERIVRILRQARMLLCLNSRFREAFAGTGFMGYVLPTLKTVVFGFIIGTVSSYLGYTATGGSEGIGRASTLSVVLSSMVLIVINVVLVRIIFLLFPGGAL